MNVLRQIEKGVEEAEFILEHDVENAKKYKNSYREDVEILIQANDTFLENAAKEYKVWAETCEQVYEIPQTGIFITLKRDFLMMITNYYLNKYTYQMEESGRLGKRLEAIKRSFDGFIYLTA